MHPEIHTNRLFIGHFLTPFGTIALIHDGDALHKVLFPGQKACDGLLADELPSWLAGPLRGYFRGELQALNTIPLHLEGTPFQQRVWQALRQIPAGETRSYAQLAQAVDNPKGYRAAGSANGRNPCGLVVPLPPRHCRQRHAGRLFRGAGHQTLAAASRRRRFRD